MSDFLQLAGKSILVMGLANRKSVAWYVGQLLREQGARVIYAVHTESRLEALRKLVDAVPLVVCDVEKPAEIAALPAAVARHAPRLDGLVHSLAFASYDGGWRPFHETSREAFLQAVDISCYSLLAVSNALRTLLSDDASVVTVSISTTRMAAENYGFMAPVKAALDSAVVFLAKSFSNSSRVRFNAVGAGLLKTASSAGIPGYVDSYLFAEQATLRKQALRTEEVAAAVAFLLSPRSSGINAQHLIVDAGMSVNYFDRSIVSRAVGSGETPSA